MLYFFHDKTAVISHGLTKEDVVPKREIELAISRSAQFGRNPEKHATRSELMAKKTTRNAVEILRNRYVKNDPKRKASVATERMHSEIARLLYDMRTEAGLTQKQLAELVGTTQSVISRLEDSDYDGHSLSMLNRIAEAMHKKLSVVVS